MMPNQPTPSLRRATPRQRKWNKMFMIKHFDGANTLFGDVAQRLAAQYIEMYGPIKGPAKFTQFMKEMNNETDPQ